MVIKKLDYRKIQSIYDNFNFNFFTYPENLNQIFPEIDWWGYLKGEEIICIWPVPIGKNKAPLKGLPFTYYVGPIWKKPLPTLPEHGALHISKLVYGSFVEKFLQEYSSFGFELPFNLIDIRPFLWLKSNFNNIKVETKYSAIIEVGPFEVMSNKFRQVRRWELKKVPRSTYIIEYKKQNCDEVIKFYNTQGFTYDLTEDEYPIFKTLENYLNLDESFGLHSISIREITSKELIGFALLGIFNTTMNIILDITRKQKKEDQILSTALHELIFRFAYSNDIKLIDFNGANSEKLSDAKHSWGASPILYFRIGITNQYE
jgi:hypothetical protein